MSRPPDHYEWDTSRLTAARRANLESGKSFEEITTIILDRALITHVKIEPYRSPGPNESKNARQVIFRASIGQEAIDLLYNAPDGLRGRYWRSAEEGFLATRRLIRALMPALLTFASAHPPAKPKRSAAMSIDDIRASLHAPSAKVWVRERDDATNALLVAGDLGVRRWKENESSAPFNKGMWRKTASGDEIEIKGALLEPDRTEYIPEGKRDRSCQIHHFGFT